MSEHINELPAPKRSLAALLVRLVSATALFWIPAGIFLILASEIHEREPFFGDIGLLQAIHTFTTPLLTTIFKVITTLGSAPFVIPIILLAVITLWLLERKRDAMFVLFSAGGTAAINGGLKLVFTRNRPDLWQHLVIENDYSFPSGHAMISSALALTIILLAWRTTYRWYAVAFGVLYTLLVGLSRLYLGVHYPSDVLGGWCVSILWVIVIYHATARISHKKQSS
jgi:membrane-associated phospholipid phosphatase